MSSAFVKIKRLLSKKKSILPDVNKFKHIDDDDEIRTKNANGQDFYAIRDRCIRTNTLWEDTEFPANDSVIFYSHKPQRKYVWLRPHEIVKNPKFVIDGYSRFDVKQGELGDCWFLAAAASLTQYKKLFSKVVPSCNFDFDNKYTGAFHFRFWQYNNWIDVVVDDRLPTYGGELVFSTSSTENEFWSVLLEKAYAKLYGSYEAISGGNVGEAFEDLTGGVCEMYNLNNAPDNLWKILERSFERRAMVGCSMEPDPNVYEAVTDEGLIRGHAYSITKVKMADIKTPNIKGQIQLIRLRNPWGNSIEWKGAWSDSATEWQFISHQNKIEMGLTFDADGEFWMSYRDFLRQFDRLEICNFKPDSLDLEDKVKLKWQVSTFEGEWVRNISAGGCRNNLDTFGHNPQYAIHIEAIDCKMMNVEENTAIIALMQKYRRSRRNKGEDCLTIGFVLYKVTEDDLKEKPLKKQFFQMNLSAERSPFINTREVTLRVKLKPGHYIIIPSTFDPNHEGEFLIRVFSETSSHLQENDQNLDIVDNSSKDIINNNQMIKKADLEDLFTNIAGEDKEIDWMELKQLLDHIFREYDAINMGFSKDICRSLIAMLDNNNSGKLDFEEFRVLIMLIANWRVVIQKFDPRKTGYLSGFQLRDALNTAGFKLNLRILNSIGNRYGTRDGSIAIDDFILCVVKIKMMLDIFKKRDRHGINVAKFTVDEFIQMTVYS